MPAGFDSSPDSLALNGSADQWSGRLPVKEKIGGSNPLGTASGSVAEDGKAPVS
jgi:hypothetical protein